jgi:glycosyltransferase involved in cell wall biosynthesis
VLLALRRYRPDLIHCEYEQESLGAAQVALARRLLRPQARLTLYAYQNILRPRRAAVRALSAFTRRAADAVLCASSEAASVLHQQGYGGLTPVIPGMGVDTALFQPLPAPPAHRPPVIGYAGRLVPEKGVDTLLQAAAQLPLPVEVRLAGEGPEQPRLATLAATLGLAERCRFVGPVAYAAMPAFLRALDVLVLPSRTTPNWKEQFGRVLVEALACGVAVVGSDSGAIPEVIGPAGGVFPEGDAAALAHTLADLLAQPARRAELRALGLARVQAHYTVERVAAAVAGVWRELCP